MILKTIDLINYIIIRFLCFIFDIDYNNIKNSKIQNNKILKNILNRVVYNFKKDIDMAIPLILAIISFFIDKNLINFGPTLVAASLCFVFNISASRKQYDNSKNICKSEKLTEENEDVKTIHSGVHKILDNNYLFIFIFTFLFILNCLIANSYYFKTSALNQSITTIFGIICYVFVILLYQVYSGIREEKTAYLLEIRLKNCPNERKLQNG